MGLRFRGRPDRFSPGRTSVFLAVLAGFTTYGDLEQATGLGRSTIHRHLAALREAGMVAWEPDTEGTLRAEGRWLIRTP